MFLQKFQAWKIALLILKAKELLLPKTMRVAIVRRALNASFSMDVYADGIISGLKTVRPDWEIVELVPQPNTAKKSLLSGIKKYYQRYWAFPAIVKKQQVDVFHIIDHSDGHIVYWLKNSGTPLVVTCHDLINFLQPENIGDQAQLPWLSTFVWKAAAKGICQADRIVTVSAHTAKDVTQILGVQPDRITVAPNAVEPLFHPLASANELRQKYQIPPETICLLNVGSNHPRKNVFTALKVLKVLRDQGVSAHFLKTGADFTTEQRTFLQAHHLTDCATYLGKPDRSSLVEIYNAADILLAPSLYEGFGITLLEAMACGTPVIASNTTSLPEVVGDAAIVLDPMDAQAMAQAVCHISQDAAYRQLLIEKGLARAKLFTWQKTAEQIAEVYEHLIHEKSQHENSSLGICL